MGKLWVKKFIGFLAFSHLTTLKPGGLKKTLEPLKMVSNPISSNWDMLSPESEVKVLLHFVPVNRSDERAGNLEKVYMNLTIASKLSP